MYKVLLLPKAEKVIALIQRKPLDYTQCLRTLWPDKSIEEISHVAMKQWRRPIAQY